MPQKKNADSLELVRGKSGRVLGNVSFGPFLFDWNPWLIDLWHSSASVCWPCWKARRAHSTKTCKRTRKERSTRTTPFPWWSKSWVAACPAFRCISNSVRKGWAPKCWLPMSPTIWFERRWVRLSDKDQLIDWFEMISDAIPRCSRSSRTRGEGSGRQFWQWFVQNSSANFATDQVNKLNWLIWSIWLTTVVNFSFSLDIIHYSRSPLFTGDICEVWDYRNSVDQYTCEGGTATSAVKQQLEQFRQYLESKRF